MFGNVAGLYPRSNTVKVQYLGELAKESDTFVIALTESHLKSHILDTEVSIPGFQLVRADRQDHINKGGVITYVKEEYAYGLKVISSGCNGTTEWMCIFLPAVGVVIANMYRPPACVENKFKEMLADASAAIERLGSPMPTVIVCGDFNLPIMNWETGSYVGGTTDMQRQAEALLEFMNVHCLQQMVNEPTRIHNILDLFLTNNAEIVMNIETANTVISDHRLITVNTYIDIIQEPKIRKDKLEGFAGLNFHHKRIDWAELNQDLQLVNWKEELDGKTDNEMLSLIYENLLCSCQKFIPRKGELIRKSIIPRDRRILMRNRANMNKQMSKARGTKKLTLIKKLEVVEYKLLESHKKEERVRELRAIDSIKDKSKYFFSYAKSKSTFRIPIGPLEKDGKIVENPQEISQILQEQFVSVFSQPKFSQTDPRNMNIGHTNQTFNDVEVTVDDIEEAIGKLSKDSAPGPDGIPSVLLKECMHSLKEPLCLLWRQSMLTGHIPDRLKLGQITPIHKGGSRNEVKNYRPITLTSHIIKIFERVLTMKLVEYLEANSLFNQRQHGFRRGRSCLSQLIDHYQNVLNIMESGNNADVIYLDFAKAFDKVDHGILIRKLANIGVGGQILSWIYEFLYNRRQIVKVANCSSDSADVISGVPQGTVLGPILFLIFVGDIDEGLRHAEASSFADDTRVVLQVGNENERLNLQRDLEALYEWSDTNNMMFNGGKFQHLRFGPPQSDRRYVTPEGELIAMANDVRDLGITMGANGNFEAHVSDSVLKGSQMAGRILRTFQTRETAPMMILYKALVLPLLEYCCQIWSPKKLGLIKRIESVQRHFTAKLSGTADMKYKERLTFLKIYSLERRRDRYAIIYIWKIIQGLVPNLLGKDRIRPVDTNVRLGRYCVLPNLNHNAPRYVQTLRENSFCVSGPKLFNILDKDLRNFDGTLETFKRKLDQFLATVTDIPVDPNEPQVVTSNSLIDQVAQGRLRLRSCPQR